jgi:hypothetical protein
MQNIAAATASNLALHSRLQMSGLNPNPHEGGFAFRLPIAVPGHREVSGISASSVKVIEWNDLATTVIETALYGADGEIVFIPEIGYEDIRLHNDFEDLLRELARLTSDNVGDPDAQSDSEDEN